MATFSKAGKRIGRPPSPPGLTVKDAPYERKEYADRLRAIVDAVEVGDLSKDVERYLQMLIRRYDLLGSIDEKRFRAKGDEEVTLLLRVVAESTNGPAALSLTILREVYNCMEPVWIEKGLAFIEAFDLIDLVELQATLSALGLDDQLDRVLRRKLEGILGSPRPPAVPKKPPARPKMEKTARPPMISEETGDAVLAMRKSKRKPARRVAA